MIRFFFRTLGLIALAAAFVAVLYDGTKTIAGNELSITVLRQTWSNLHPESLAALQSAAARGGGWLVTATQTVLDQPTALIFAVLGALLLLIGRKKRPLIGYARR